MTFAEVYYRLFEGLAIRRRSWKTGVLVRLHKGEIDFLVIHYANGNSERWCISVVDLYDKKIMGVVSDWEVVE